jgi:hypothetical protein
MSEEFDLIFFASKYCRKEQHSICAGSWIGLGVRVSCECSCHKTKIASGDLWEQSSPDNNTVAISVGEPEHDQT